MNQLYQPPGLPSLNRPSSIQHLITHFFTLTRRCALFFLTISLLTAIHPLTVQAQTEGDFETVHTGNWDDPTVWERFSNGSWVPVTQFPLSLIHISEPTRL